MHLLLLSIVIVTYLPADLSDPAVLTGSMQPWTLLQDFGEIASWGGWVSANESQFVYHVFPIYIRVTWADFCHHFWNSERIEIQPSI